MNGIFISIEGNDGSGKSTVINNIKQELLNQGYDLIVTREPGGSYVAEKIRKIILDNDNSAMDNRTEALLYAASRRQHLVETVIPALNHGKLVICDRYLDSSLAYQGYARNIGIDEVFNINSFATEGLLPGLTIYILVRPEVGIMRKSSQKELDRLEHEKLDFHKKVYDGYLLLQKRFPKRVQIVDGEGTKEEVYQKVLKVILDYLEKGK